MIKKFGIALYKYHAEGVEVYEDGELVKFNSNTKAISLSLGSIVRSNKTPKHLGATIAHELIHKLDIDKKKIKSEHWDKLVNLRDAVGKYLIKNKNKKSIQDLWKETYNDPETGEKINKLAYWLFGKRINQDEFQGILENSVDFKNLTDSETLALEDLESTLCDKT